MAVAEALMKVLLADALADKQMVRARQTASAAARRHGASYTSC